MKKQTYSTFFQYFFQDDKTLNIEPIDKINRVKILTLKTFILVLINIVSYEINKGLSKSFESPFSNHEGGSPTAQMPQKNKDTKYRKFYEKSWDFKTHGNVQIKSSETYHREVIRIVQNHENYTHNHAEKNLFNNFLLRKDDLHKTSSFRCDFFFSLHTGGKKITDIFSCIIRSIIIMQYDNESYSAKFRRRVRNDKTEVVIKINSFSWCNDS